VAAAQSQQLLDDVGYE